LKLYRIDYKNLTQAREHLEKYMFAHTPSAVSPATSAETVINEQGQKTLISERKPIAA
jgi:hypothetical protein